MKTTAMTVFAALTLAATGCASTSMDHPVTAHNNCTIPGAYVVNPDTSLHGFATTDPSQPRLETPGTARLEGRGVAQGSNGVAARTALDTARGRGDTAYCL